MQEREALRARGRLLVLALAWGCCGAEAAPDPQPPEPRRFGARPAATSHPGGRDRGRHAPRRVHRGPEARRQSLRRTPVSGLRRAQGLLHGVRHGGDGVLRRLHRRDTDAGGPSERLSGGGPAHVHHARLRPGEHAVPGGTGRKTADPVRGGDQLPDRRDCLPVGWPHRDGRVSAGVLQAARTGAGG